MLRLFAATILLSFTLIDSVSGALRATQPEFENETIEKPASPLELFPIVDPLNCPSDPIIHDPRMQNNDPIISKFLQKRRDWLQKEFHPNRNHETFVADYEKMFVTMPAGSNFVFWEQKQGVDGHFTPVFDLSAWYEDKLGNMRVATGVYTSDTYTWNFVRPSRKEPHPKQKTIKLKGDYVVYVAGWYTLYQHVLIDHLGYLVYMSRIVPPTTRFLMPKVENYFNAYDMLRVIDPSLASRVDFMSCHDWQQCHNQVFEVEGSLRIATPVSTSRHLELYQMVRNWMYNSSKLNAVVLANNHESLVIYYKRASYIAGRARAVNQRYMDEDQETEIITRIEHALRRYGRKERLVIFDGKMSFLEQMSLFSSATTVIGTHGGGLANILLMAPAENRNCMERPKVLEFVTNPGTPKVQRADIIASYYTLYATCPWVELHQILFTEESTEDLTFINMNAFDDALKSLFGPNSEAQSMSSTKHLVV